MGTFTQSRSGGIVAAALVVLATAIVTSHGVVSPRTAVARAEDANESQPCPPVHVLAFRGSGQENIGVPLTHGGSRHSYSGSNLVTNGWEGSTLARLFNSFAEQKYPDGFEPDRVPVIGIGVAKDGRRGYPAVELTRAVFNGLDASVEEGTAAGLEEIQRIKKSLPASCDTKFVTVGFSQGAIVAREVAALSTRDVIGVVNIGDPYQKPHAPGNTGDGKGGEGIARFTAFPRDRDRFDRFYDLDIYKSSQCTKGDLICDFHFSDLASLPKKMTAHRSYLAAPEDAQATARGLADLIHRRYMGRRT